MYSKGVLDPSTPRSQLPVPLRQVILVKRDDDRPSIGVVNILVDATIGGQSSTEAN